VARACPRTESATSKACIFITALESAAFTVTVVPLETVTDWIDGVEADVVHLDALVAGGDAGQIVAAVGVGAVGDGRANDADDGALEGFASSGIGDAARGRPRVAWASAEAGDEARGGEHEGGCAEETGGGPAGGAWCGG